MRLFNRFDIHFDLESIETYIGEHLRLFVTAAAALVAFVALIAVTVFFIAIRGAEQTMVPDVVGKELTAALLELQVKELYPRIQLRYSQSTADKGNILEQDPRPGAIVKAGRRIRLVVSRGVVVDKVDNYLGQNLDDVKIHLQTLFSTSARPLLSLKEPPLYLFSTEAAGTILEQKPEAGVDIAGPVKLEFVVSKGPENAVIKVPDLIGLPIADALERIRQAGVVADFALRPPQDKESPETVVSQVPGGMEIVAAHSRIAVVVAAPASAGADEVFGLFSRDLPQYPYPLALKLDGLLPTGERRRIAQMDHPGGSFTVPYKLPRGSTLILTVLNREAAREDLPGAVQ